MILDIVILLLLLIGVWRGFRKGFIIELFTFLALFLGLYAGIHLSDVLVRWVSPQGVSDDSYLPVIAFFLCFLAIGAMVYFGGKAIEKVVKVVQLSLLNKFLGALLGLIKVVLLIGAALLLFDSYNERKKLVDTKTMAASRLYYPCRQTLLFCIPAFESSTMFISNTLTQAPDLINE